MPSISIDRYTGKLISDFAHVQQSLGVLFTTGIGTRLMRRTYGSHVPRLFGQKLVERTINRHRAAIIVAIQAWEPRFKIVQVEILKDENTPEKLRAGGFAFAIRGQYIPRGHLGDPTVEPTERTLVLGLGAQGVLVV